MFFSTLTFVRHEVETRAAESERSGGDVLLKGVKMAFGRRVVFGDLSCHFPQGKISVILGASGSGKSTMLRLIGGLIRPRAGAVIVEGQDVTRLSERKLFEVRKKLGMLFQGGALLDSETVFENMALPLVEKNHVSVAEIKRTVHETLTRVGVEDVDDLLPGELSGGMLRRVALGRAIIRKPTILLCDEPLSGLDPVSAGRIESLLSEINTQSKMTVIVVSHDVPSTMRIADWVVLLMEHRAVEGTPEELHHSADQEVAEFFREGLERQGRERRET